MNSDPGLIRFFLRFLTTAGVAPEDMVFRVCIHETADVEAAQRFWLAVTGADPSQFRTPTLKRHVTKTVRKNVGDTYSDACEWKSDRAAPSTGRSKPGHQPSCLRPDIDTQLYIEPASAPGEGFEPSLSGPKPLVLPS